jgi:hypothetical protein
MQKRLYEKGYALINNYNNTRFNQQLELNKHIPYTHLFINIHSKSNFESQKVKPISADSNFNLEYRIPV